MREHAAGDSQSHSSGWGTRSERGAKMKLLPVKKKAGSLIHPQQLNQNHNNTMMETSRWHRFQPCNPTHPFILSTPDSVFKDDDDSQLLSPRTFSDPEYSPTDWSMKSLLAVLPHSPSPVCSPCESPSASAPPPVCSSLDASFSQISKEFSTQTDKSSCTAFDIKKRSAARDEIDEWMEHANDFFQLHLQNNQSGDMDDENSIVKLPSTCQERGLGDSRCVDKAVDDVWSPITGDGRILLTRPKPYHAFLDEIQKKEAEAQADASRKAAQMKFLKELKGKEAAIGEWESRQTKIAMSQMNKIEGELERKRTKAFEEMQKKISKAHNRAIQKKVKERRSVLKKISRAIEAAEIEATKRSTKFLGWAKIC